MQSRTATRQPLPVALSAFFSLVFALTVRDLRTENKSAALGILLSAGMVLVTAMTFYIFMNLVGGRSAPIRTDDITFIVAGFLVFFFHIRTVAAVAGSLNPGLMRHSRASPFLFICVKAMASGYKMTVATLILMALNYLLRDVWEMQNGLIFILIVFTAWLGGVAIGMILLAANRYLVWGNLIQMTYIRICFFTSGKFFVAGHMPNAFRSAMDWNPLFHILDQARGALFLNYTADTTSVFYPISVYAVVLVIGMLIENYVRVNYSASQTPLGSG
ncbi:MAG: ABC transporter permease [Pseudomonadota bacterium]